MVVSRNHRGSSKPKGVDQMNRRIFNTTKNDDSDAALNDTFHFAGTDAYYMNFGFGQWYGKSIATVAIGRTTAVVAWQAGYIKGSNKNVEDEINGFIAQ